MLKEHVKNEMLPENCLPTWGGASRRRGNPTPQPAHRCTGTQRTCNVRKGRKTIYLRRALRFGRLETLKVGARGYAMIGASSSLLLTDLDDFDDAMS